MTSVIVFIDYQNMYKSAREAFGWKFDAGHYGTLKPLSLGRWLTGTDRDLVGVRVYTGVPAQEQKKRDYEIMQRRMAAWKNADPGIVTVHPRTLRYPPPNGREKGVDVELAIDFVALAIADDYEVGIVASADTDLIPALQLVRERYPEKVIETVAWAPEPGCEAPEPIDIPGGGVTRRLVSKVHFQRAIADRTNYVSSSRR